MPMRAFKVGCLLLAACASDPDDMHREGGSKQKADPPAGATPASPSSSSSAKQDPAKAPSNARTLDPAKGHYNKTCDGSGGIAIDFDHFLNLNDEDQTVRIYARGKNAGPIKELDAGKGLGIKAEGDFEDAARIGDRVFVIGSHGRNKDGALDSARQRFFALDLKGTGTNVSVSVAGSYSKLLTDLLSPQSWATPNAGVISALDAASDLDTDEDANLAPEKKGVNIEGLAAYPSANAPKRLAIGFRNPAPGGKAMLITLLNGDEVIGGGAKAKFGEAIALDLGGQAIRSMAWSAAHTAMLIIGGPRDGSSGPFSLFKWSGVPTEAPAKVSTLNPPKNGSPEAVIPYPETKDVQIIFDMGDATIGKTSCKDATSDKRFFEDGIVHVD